MSPRAVLVVLAATLVLGFVIGNILTAVAVILTVDAFRRLPTWRDPILLVGAVANAYLAIGFLVTVTIVAHEALK
jgi:hypothetical protein